MRIEDAFQARLSREDRIDNRRKLLSDNLSGESTESKSATIATTAGIMKMEPIAFVLGVASSILANILSDFITGKSDSARRSDIEKQVAIELNQSRQENIDLKHMLQQVMREIDILSRRDPDLIVTGDVIELRRPLKPRHIVFHRGDRIEHELKSRLERLDHIIAERRAELTPLTTPDFVESRNVLSSDKSSNVIPDGWERVDVVDNDSKWFKAIKEAEDNIRRRRAGERF